MIFSTSSFLSPRFFILAGVSIYLSFFIFSCSGEQPEPEVRTLETEQAVTEAQEITESVPVETAGDLEVSLWASENLVGDPIAIHMDDHGRAYITVTKRSRNSEFDIRDVDDSWRLPSISWETVEDRREFLRTTLAPERSDENTWLPDRNEDGSHDWRDLAVLEEEVWVLEDTQGRGVADHAQLYIRDFNTELTDVAGGVLQHGEDVFVAVGPDLWRIRDTNGDGIADEMESLVHGFNVHIGFSGHGMSGLIVGPDGRIYWGIGDMGSNLTDKEGNRYEYPNTGAIFRMDPDGSNFEVFAYGVRNTHEFDFDKYGNLITVDNDGDHPGEYERLVYLTDGSDSGWRINWQFGKYDDPKNNNYKVWMDESYYTPRFEDQSAHILPPLAPYHAGPAGFKYNPGTALSEQWKEHFFVMSFRGSRANSPLYAFTLEEDGASFKLASEVEAMTGILAVGIDFGPDGALYLTDWIDGWGINDEGRIWKLDAPGDASSALRTETRQLLEADFHDHTTAELTELLSHEDMRVRQKAQFELVDRNNQQALADAIESDTNQLARIHGIWGLAQIGRSEIDAVEPIQKYLSDSDAEIRAQAARMLGDVRYEPAGDALIPLLSDEHARVRYFAAEALGRIGYQEAVQPIVEMLEANNDEDVYLRHGGAIALARIGDSESVTELSNHSSRAVRIAAVVALKRMRAPGVARFLQDSDEYVVVNAARAIMDDHFIEDAIPALAMMLDQKRFTSDPLLRRAMNANLYSGSATDARRLGEFSLQSEAPTELKVEALDILKYWDNPSIFDRVTGRHRGAVSNERSDAQEVISAIMDSHFSGEVPELKVATLQAVGELEMTQVSDEILLLVHNDASEDVRRASLEALYVLDYPNMDDVLAVSLKDGSETVRTTALNLLVDSELPANTKAELFATVLREGSVAERKQAYDALSQLNTEKSEELLLKEVELLKAEELDTRVHLELVLAVEESESESLKGALESYYATQEQDALTGYRETLFGGNPMSGRRIFYQDVAAECIRCHMVNNQGAEVGPDLTTIADRLDREELLLSMIDPAAKLTPGYSSLTITKSDGETVSGLYQGETDSEITLTVSGEDVSVSKDEISESRRIPSAMPAVGDRLSRNQIRDLVEFLSTLSSD